MRPGEEAAPARERAGASRGPVVAHGGHKRKKVPRRLSSPQLPVIEEEHQVSRSTQGEQDNYEMHVRSANIVRAGESLMRLVSDLKQYLILNDFPSVNEAINQRSQQLRGLQDECDRKLISLRDEIAIDLYELEEEYYSSSVCEPSGLPLCEAYWLTDSSPQDPCTPVMSENSALPSQVHASPHVNGHGVSMSEHS
ncbi:unnamed protein product [Ranitomeya imitator]|uniref:Mediator of RNA polymerase II transcription subunit 22 n=1 Tax=Ranitomeya imitator TaxID=111125 RepID=A0ABN9LAS2_9NEOB|nr:unnamed protein product [Ranitomeya imitator]